MVCNLSVADEPDRAQSAATTESSAVMQPQQPVIDRDLPQATETALFALG